MKVLLTAITAFAISTSAYADISTGNDDLYGWVVDDHESLNAPRVAYDSAESPFGDPDQYGGILFTRNTGGRGSSAEVGIGDSYGSILHSVGFNH